VVWTIPSPWRRRVRCCPSSLYTFPKSGLGSGLPVKVSPNLGSSTPTISRQALNDLGPVRLPFRHARKRFAFEPLFGLTADAKRGPQLSLAHAALGEPFVLAVC